MLVHKRTVHQARVEQVTAQSRGQVTLNKRSHNAARQGAVQLAALKSTDSQR